MPYGGAEAVSRLLAARTWAIVGLTGNSERTAYAIAAFLQTRGARVAPVNPDAAPVLDEPGYATLAEVPFVVDVVGVYRRSEYAGRHMDEAVAVGARGIWLPLGVEDLAAARRAEEAGLDVVMDRCPLIDWRVYGPDARPA